METIVRLRCVAVVPKIRGGLTVKDVVADLKLDEEFEAAVLAYGHLQIVLPDGQSRDWKIGLVYPVLTLSESGAVLQTVVQLSLPYNNRHNRLGSPLMPTEVATLEAAGFKFCHGRQLNELIKEFREIFPGFGSLDFDSNSLPSR